MKFLALCPCDRVIFDKNDTPSLISILQNLEITFQIGPGGESVPPDAVVPRDWFIYARWESNDDDVGKPYVEHFVAYWPDGKAFLETSLSLKEIKADDHIQQCTMHVMGFPSGQQGIIRIVTWLTVNGQRASEDVQTLIRVKHKREPTTGQV